jgi:hypothetical protein
MMPVTNAQAPTHRVRMSAVMPGQGDHARGSREHAEQQVAEDRPGVPAGERTRPFRGSGHECIDGEQDDERAHGDVRPGHGNHTDGDGQDAPPEQEVEIDLNMEDLLKFCSES